MARDISSAHTLPVFFYRDKTLFEKLGNVVFSNSWHYAGSADHLFNSCLYTPLNILPDFLDQPVLLVKDKEGHGSCLSNVCTHRGSILITEPGNAPIIRCPYHGRCFGIDGSFRSMPGFEEVQDFPGPEDDLAKLGCARLGPMVFSRLQGHLSFEEHFSSVLMRMSWFEHDNLMLHPDLSRTYHVNAHWAIYVDNYLEGFHVPYVHPSLNQALDVKAYQIECFDNAVLQIGYASESESAILDIPKNSEYAGQRIFALYWWVFPNIMLNYYPWGISLNIVEPVTPSVTRVRFETYVDRNKQPPDISAIHQTELEDEAIVETVQRGMNSLFYKQGRYSPAHESGVFRFHEILRKVVTRA